MYLKTIKKIHVSYLDKKNQLHVSWNLSEFVPLTKLQTHLKYGPVKQLLFLLKRSIIKNDIYLKNCSLPGYVANLTLTG